jgi:hypothetical protein
MCHAIILKKTVEIQIPDVATKTKSAFLNTMQFQEKQNKNRLFFFVSTRKKIRICALSCSLKEIAIL